MDEGRGLTRITTKKNNDEIRTSDKFSVSDLKKFNNQLGDDVGKIDAQEEKGENRHERWYDRFI